MRDVLAGIILVWIFAVTFFPKDVGMVAHKKFIEMKAGWEEVQP